MQTKLYTIRDSKGEFYGPPFTQKTHGEAERSFHTLTNDPKSNVNQYPEDFDLYYLGEYDDISGKIKPNDTPQHIVKAVSVKTAQI
jgi:hypothetical protein